MENFETNDSNKNLTNETSSERSDAEGIKEKDVLKTDLSEEETPSDDVQDPVNGSAAGFNGAKSLVLSFLSLRSMSLSTVSNG